MQIIYYLLVNHFGYHTSGCWWYLWWNKGLFSEQETGKAQIWKISFMLLEETVFSW